MSIDMIVTLIIAAFAVILALIGMSRAVKRSWLMAVVRLGVTLFSAVTALSVTALIAEQVSDYAYTWILPHLGEGLQGFLNEVPVGAEGVRVIASLLAAPLIFLVAFFVIRLVLSIAAWILERILPFLKKKSLRLVGAALGAANGLLVALVVMIPLVGYLMLGASVLNTFVDSGMTETAFVQNEVMKPLGMTEKDLESTANTIEKHPVLSVIYDTVGEAVFDELTAARLDATATHGIAIEMDLETELCGLLKTAGYAMEVMESMEKEDYTSADKEYLFHTADAFFESEWMKLFATDTLVAMSQSWLKGEEFAGMPRPTLDATVAPTLDEMLEILSSETTQTLEEDIHAIMDVAGDFLIHDLMDEGVEYTEMVQKLGNSGLLTDMMAKLEANERLRSLAGEIKALSMRLVSNMLGLDQLKDGQYGEMLGNVAGTLNDVLDMSREEREELILDSIKDSFGQQGFDVPDEVALEMSDQMIEELGADGEITADELTDYLVNHAESGLDLLPDELPDMQP